MTADFCPPDHTHDALCDPTYREPRVTPDPDPTHTNHVRFMDERNQEGWSAWQRSRPLPVPEETKQSAPKTKQSVPVKKKGRR